MNTLADIQRRLIKEHSQEFYNKLENHIKKQLLKLGYVFEEEGDFYKFIKENVVKTVSATPPIIYTLTLNTKERPVIAKYTVYTEIVCEKGCVKALLTYKFL